MKIYLLGFVCGLNVFINRIKLCPTVALALVSAAMSDSNLQDVLKKANDQFTAKFFSEVAKNEAGKSFVMSAYSVMSPLAQLALASVGPSHEEILTAIGMPNDNVTKEVFSDANARVRSVKGVELKEANKIYVRKGYALNEKFATDSKAIFNSEVQNINFKDAQGSADEINAWVEDHTNKRIKNLVDPSTITDITAAVLVNAIFFKGNWASPFDNESTQDREFTSTKGKKLQVPMMTQSDYFRYSDNQELDAKFLEMSYEGGETSFVVVLPNKHDGLNSLLEKLKDPAAFSKGYSNIYNSLVHVSLPKFKIETTTDLKKLLQKIDVKRLFVEDLARLDNLIAGEENLSISDAIQKAFIEVDEKGTEAAAANKFGIAFATSIGGPTYEYFNADHPFAFFLMQGNNILFSGVFQP